MIFAKAKVWSRKYKFETFRICSEEEEDNYDSMPVVVYYENLMAQKIMKAAAEGGFLRSFSIDEGESETTKYYLIKYRGNEREPVYNSFRQIIPKKIVHLPRNTPVTVFREKCSCESCRIRYGFDSIVLYTAIVHPVNDKTEIKMNLYRCVHCNKLFVEELELDPILTKYGRLDVNFYYPDYLYEEDEEEEEISNLKNDSILSRNGYHTTLSAKRRHEILRDLIDSNPQNIHHIIHHINFLIRFQGSSHPDAKAVWESDLSYINYYTREHNIQQARFDR